MRMFNFEKLQVWQKSKDLVIQIYKVTKYYPKEELYGLTSQLRRAAISVSSNLAEGSSRKTGKDMAYFTTLAYSSLMEVMNQLIISYELAYLPEREYLEFRSTIEEIGRMLNALRNSQEKFSWLSDFR